MDLTPPIIPAPDMTEPQPIKHITPEQLVVDIRKLTGNPNWTLAWKLGAEKPHLFLECPGLTPRTYELEARQCARVVATDKGLEISIINAEFVLADSLLSRGKNELARQIDMIARCPPIISEALSARARRETYGSLDGHHASMESDGTERLTQSWKLLLSHLTLRR